MDTATGVKMDTQQFGGLPERKGDLWLSAREHEAVRAMYSADRADGSAIFSASMQFVGIIVTYAAVGFTVLGSDVLSTTAWVRGLIAVPLWGLMAYLTVLNALMSARVDSVARLERVLRTGLEPVLGTSPAGSQSGDVVTDISGDQPRPLLVASVFSFGPAFLGVCGLTYYSVWSVVGAWPTGWWFLAAAYVGLSLGVLNSVFFTASGGAVRHLRGLRSSRRDLA